METNAEEGDTNTAAFFYRPLIVLLVLITTTQTTREGKINSTDNNVPNDQPKETVRASPPKKKKKKIYLTFDDGPNKGTRKVLRIVQQEQVPVTFFIIGEHVFASTTQRATWDSLQLTDSIEICNHSYTHALHNHYARFYQTPDTVVKDFRRCYDSLQLNNAIVRTPGRNIWRVDTLTFTDLKKSAAAADSLQQAGFTIMGWDLEWHYDHKTFTLVNRSEFVLQEIDSLFAHNKTMTPENLVLLAHDQVYDDSDDSCELHELIKCLKKRDEYELVVASKYPGVKALP